MDERRDARRYEHNGQGSKEQLPPAPGDDRQPDLDHACCSVMDDGDLFASSLTADDIRGLLE